MDSIRRVWHSWSPGWRTPWLAGTPTQLCSCGLANAESVASEPTSIISVALLHPSSTSPLRRDPLAGKQLVVVGDQLVDAGDVAVELVSIECRVLEDDRLQHAN